MKKNELAGQIVIELTHLGHDAGIRRGSPLDLALWEVGKLTEAAPKKDLEQVAKMLKKARHQHKLMVRRLGGAAIARRENGFGSYDLAFLPDVDGTRRQAQGRRVDLAARRLLKSRARWVVGVTIAHDDQVAAPIQAGLPSPGTMQARDLWRDFERQSLIEGTLLPWADQA